MPRTTIPIELRHATKLMLLDGILAAPPKRKRRLQAMLAFYEHSSHQEAAAAAGVTVRSVQRWLRAWNAGGPDALTAKLKGGRRPKISVEDFVTRVLPLILETGVEKEVWNLAELRRQLAAEHGISVSYSALRRYLQQRGYRPRHPAPSTTSTWVYPWPQHYGKNLAEYLQRQAAFFNAK